MPVDLDNSSTVSGEASVSISSTGNQNPLPNSTGKKKRNLPGMPGKLQKSKLYYNSKFLNFC
jgi:hypothetical protein